MRSEAGKREARSLTVAMWGNLLMGAAGLVAGIVSNSNAVLIDGLFSMIGFTAAALGRWVGGRVDLAPDRTRPLGYAADEALYTTFRAMSLLGLTFFAISAAVQTIVAYLGGVAPGALRFGPTLIYFLFVGTICLILWAVHHTSYIRGGRNSEILRIEARAAAFDGMLTLMSAAGIGAIYLMRDGPLSGIAPVGDSVIVILLCLAVVRAYVRDFLSGLGELSGVTASPARFSVVRRALRPVVAEDGGQLRDLSVIKIGRSFWVTVYYDPGRAVTAREMDRLNHRMIRDIRAALPGSDVLMIPTEQTRCWPAADNPYA